MKKKEKIICCLIFIFIFLHISFSTYADIGDQANKPPMGWNSYDCFIASVLESDIKTNADYMAAYLKQYGWEYIVVDYLWHYPDPVGGIENPTQDLSTFTPWYNMDEYGRLFPSEIKFPSSADGQGFKPLADYVHSLGLKFGIHIMRGIPRQAVDSANTPVLGTGYYAGDIADRDSTCSWNQHMYGLDMTHPGAQAYLNSLLDLYASWGVDYIKVDDLSRPYHKEEIEGYRTAIEQCGREIVFSTSPGATTLDEAEHIKSNANLWRISDDFWDEWDYLYEQFNRLRNWSEHIGPGHWPDADMIPIGYVKERWESDRTLRLTHFTETEQKTLMSLWSIARSPLMWGGNLPDNNSYHLSLMTNSNILAVNQGSINNRLVVDGSYPVWSADDPATNDKYLAIFNKTDQGPVSITVDLNQIGVSGNCQIIDAWSGSNLGTFSDSFSRSIAAHGSGLYRVVPESLNNYEAEASSNTLNGAAVVTDDPDSQCSNGAFVGYIGNGADNWLQFNNIIADTDGTYLLTIYYMSGEDRQADIQVDSSPAITVSFPSTNGWYGNNLGTVRLEVSLSAGNHSITIGNSGDYAPNIDQIAVYEGQVTKYYRIVSKMSEKVIDIADGDTSDGANVQQWEWNGADCQRFQLMDAGNGYVKIVAKHSSKLIDIYTASVDDGGNIVQWQENGGDNQLWQLVDNGDGYVMIVSKLSGKALDVYNASTDYGANIVQWTIHGGDNQLWLLEEVQ